MLTFKAVSEALTKCGVTPEILFNEDYTIEQVKFLNEELALDGAISLVEFAGGEDNEDERNTFAFPGDKKTVYISVTKKADKYPTGFEDAVFQQMVRNQVVTYRPFSNEKEA
jgi:hypothetical protein